MEFKYLNFSPCYVTANKIGHGVQALIDVEHSTVRHLNFLPAVLINIYVLWPVTSIKGKAIPLQAWKDPEGSWRLRLPCFKKIGT
jgi:hypothetical protein